MPGRFEPKLLTVLREGYTRPQFLSDLTAGVIVGIVALPLAIAFAIASGVKPEQGLFTAVIAGLIVSAFGGSRVQIAGPTGAFIVIVYGIVQSYGYDGLMVATMMAGVMLLVMGLARFGTLLKFVPYPLVVGFTSGIALIIFSSQVNDLLGLRVPNLPADFIGKWAVYAVSFAGTDIVSVAVGVGSLGVILVVQRLGWKLPGSLLVLVLATAAVHSMRLPVETIGSRFGEVPMMLPAPRLPSFSWQDITRLFSPAVTIALLGAIESLLSAVVSDGMIRSRHRSNMELVAQGAANILSPLFAGIPATGAIARTATNVKSGGRTPVAGIVHAVVLLLIMLFFGKWAGLIPMPALAAILVVVSYNMSEWRSFRKILRAPRSDVTVMLVTFFLTVVVDLTAAIQIGIILSAMFFIRRMAEVSQVTPLTKDLQDADEKEAEGGSPQKIPDGVEVFEVFGSLFFGAVDQFTETIRELRKKPKVFILETKNLLAIDATGLRALEELIGSFSHQGTTMIISGIHKQPLFAIVQAGLMDKIGEDNVCGSLEEALERARSLTASKS
ncbi:MAG TPA: SulP family inorganic anion transporter [Bacteroidota bacterium]|nr:SulP family inorganic anion transporter [Bacteroidota bacterium]